jgi:deazaflavin-dependent oxidoreductase (nitroreductase family)
MTDKEEARGFNERNIAEFRANGGKLSSFGDAPILLLTTVGSKTGRQRVTPTMYMQDDGDRNRVHVFASNAGSDANPDWFNNLVAHPNDVGVEIGRERVQASAQVLPEDERAATYAEQGSRYPGFAAYQEMTHRRIPVVALTLLRASPREPRAT